MMEIEVKCIGFAVSDFFVESAVDQAGQGI